MKSIIKILDKIILGFWIAAGVTLFQFTYVYAWKIIRKLLEIIIVVKDIV